MQRERALGSVRYIIYFTVLSIVIQLTFAVLIFLLHFINSEFMRLPNFGVISVFFAEIVAECLSNPEAVQR